VALQESVKIIYYFNHRLLELTEDYFGAFSDHVLVRFCFSCLALFFPVSSYGAMAQLSRDHGRDQHTDRPRYMATSAAIVRIYAMHVTPAKSRRFSIQAFHRNATVVSTTTGREIDHHHHHHHYHRHF